MSNTLTSRAPSRSPAFEFLVRVFRHLLPSGDTARRAHDWREIETVLRDYELRKAEIAAFVRSRSV